MRTSGRKAPGHQDVAVMTAGPAPEANHAVAAGNAGKAGKADRAARAIV